MWSITIALIDLSRLLGNLARYTNHKVNLLGALLNKEVERTEQSLKKQEDE